MMDYQTVFVRLPSPLASLHLRLPSATPLSDIPLPAANCNAYLRRASSGPLNASTTLRELANDHDHPIHLEYCVRLLGGKGGFGSQLRAAGGRMSSGKASNNDSCRDLSGRRLATVKEAQKLADYVEAAAQREKDAAAAKKAKLEALEKQLGISSPSTSGGPVGAPEAEAGPSTLKRKITPPDLAEIAQKKHRFNDTAYLEQSREINDNVRNAVTAGLLKKRKANKAKPPAVGGSSASSEVTVGKTAEADKGKAPAEVPATA